MNFLIKVDKCSDWQASLHSLPTCVENSADSSETQVTPNEQKDRLIQI